MNRNRVLIILFLIILVLLISFLYVFIFSSPTNNLQLKYDRCMGFTRFYTPKEVSFLVPSQVKLSDKLDDNNLLGITFWKRTGRNTLFIYYVSGGVNNISCRDYLGIKLTPLYMPKNESYRGVSIMIILNLYENPAEAEQVFSNEVGKLLDKGYQKTSISGYPAIYRDRVAEDISGYLKINYPTHVAIKLKQAIIVVYSVYSYKTLKNYLTQLITA